MCQKKMCLMPLTGIDRACSPPVPPAPTFRWELRVCATAVHAILGMSAARAEHGIIAQVARWSEACFPMVDAERASPAMVVYMCGIVPFS